MPETKRLPAVHLAKWPRGLRVFKKDVDDAPRDMECGTQVEVLDYKGESCGFGLWHPQSMIAVRIMRKDAPVDDEWLISRVHKAIERRKAAGVDISAPCRILHAESDDVPALMVDRFGDTLSATLFSEIAMPLWDLLAPVLHEALGTQPHKAVLDHKAARAEGCAQAEQSSEECPSLIKITENNVRYEVDMRDGHKTGFFCDQRENRRRLAEEVKRCIERKGSCTVADICCYSGGFALSAAMAGATKVVGVDLDEKAIAVAKRNANLNQASQIKFTHADAFAWCRQIADNDRKFDIVVLDPPKFIPNRNAWDEGIAKYHDLNKVSAPLLEEGGMFLTCSCSGLLPANDFREKVRLATKRLGRPLREEGFTGPGPDHPVRLDYPEGSYLKALWLRG